MKRKLHPKRLTAMRNHAMLKKAMRLRPEKVVIGELQQSAGAFELLTAGQ